MIFRVWGLAGKGVSRATSQAPFGNFVPDTLCHLPCLVLGISGYNVLKLPDPDTLWESLAAPFSRMIPAQSLGQPGRQCWAGQAQLPGRVGTHNSFHKGD